jgi:hypothetical protein
MVKPRLNQNKMTKKFPVSQSEAPTLLSTPFSTHRSFRWTLLLTEQSNTRGFDSQTESDHEAKPNPCSQPIGTQFVGTRTWV